MDKKIITLEVGRFRCKEVRNLLREFKFAGMDIDYIESDGLLVRRFSIKGSKEHLDRVDLCLRRLYKGED